MRLSTLNSERLIRFLEKNASPPIVNMTDNEKQHHLPYQYTQDSTIQKKLPLKKRQFLNSLKGFRTLRCYTACVAFYENDECIL